MDENSPDWEDLLNCLLDDSAATPVILVIDALDEFLEVEELLQYLAKVVQSRENLCLLCSSRPHVQVAGYFHDGLVVEIDTMSGKRGPDMSLFVKTSIEERTTLPETRKSIFCCESY